MEIPFGNQTWLVGKSPWLDGGVVFSWKSHVYNFVIFCVYIYMCVCMHINGEIHL